MSKFKKGDRVRNLEETEWVPKNSTGTVDEDDSQVPFVIWDEVTEYAKECDALKPMICPRNEIYLELIDEKANANDL